MSEYNVIDFNQIFTVKNIIIYLIIINAIALVAMWIDKNKAKRGTFRISERALFMLVILGGGVGRNCRNVLI